MKKRRICLFSFLAYPLFNKSAYGVFGGAEIDLYNLALELAKDPENEVTFVVGDHGQPHIEYYGNIKVIRIRYYNPNIYTAVHHKILRQLMIWKEQVFLKCDILVTEASGELLGWLAIISKGLKHGRLIFRLASDMDTDFATTRSKGFRHYILYKLGIYNADVVISQTDRQRKLLKDNLNLDSIVVKNGLYVDACTPVNHKKYILWVARSHECKRPDLFVELAKRLPSEKFVMIMPGTNQTRSRIEKKIEGVSNITLIDYVPFPDIQRYYNGAKLFVNTSEYEGFPNAFIQACLGKTPILSLKVNPDQFIDSLLWCNYFLLFIIVSSSLRNNKLNTKSGVEKECMSIMIQTVLQGKNY